MSKFVRQFRRSFKVGDVLRAIGCGDATWRVDYIGTELVVVTDFDRKQEFVYWERVYNWRKVKA